MTKTVQALINKTWLIIAVLALLVSLYVTFTDGFIDGKAYIFLIIAAACGYLYKFKKNLVK